MKVQSAALALAMALGTMWAACSSTEKTSPTGGTGGGTGGGTTGGMGGGTGGSSGSGTTGGTGGTAGSNGAGGNCPNVTSCGGNVVGIWTVTSSCLTLTGELDPTLVGAKCQAPKVTGSLEVRGSLSANGNGTYTDNTTTSGTEKFSLTPDCLFISSTPVTCLGMADTLKNLGYASVECTSASNGGCDCTATVQQTGGLGVVVAEGATSGNYTKSDTQISIAGADATYAYCVSGDQLTLTPQGASPAVTGTMVFQKASASVDAGRMTGGDAQADSGGAGGAGGAAGSGGASGAAGAGGTRDAGGAPDSGGAGSSPSGSAPCDIYKSGGNACVAAHSTVRALIGSYAGKLYQVRNSGGTTKDINAIAPGGIADAAAQSTFCSGTTCLITMVYDQTGHGLDLTYEGQGSPVGGLSNVQPSSATKEPIKAHGNTVYGLWMDAGKAYWVDGSKKGMPLGAEPEGMYMVTSGTHSNGLCCFDYGNAGTQRRVAGAATMDALNFSSIMTWGRGAGSGPWVMADMEFGLFAWNTNDPKKPNPDSPTQTSPFVTAVLKNNGTTEFALRGGNAASGQLGTYYKGALPNGYNPMKKQGAIVLGSGGDCCMDNMNLAVGTFYEGCIVSGYPADATEDAVQANIVAAGYSK